MSEAKLLLEGSYMIGTTNFSSWYKLLVSLTNCRRAVWCFFCCIFGYNCTARQLHAALQKPHLMKTNQLITLNSP